MQELRIVLIIVGAAIIIALFLHGLWTSKKEKPTRLMGRSEDDRKNNQVPSMYDKDGLGEVRVVKPAQTPGKRKEPELHFSQTNPSSSDSDTEDALFKHDAFSCQYFDDEQDELPAPSTMPSQSKAKMAATARPRAAQTAVSDSYARSQNADSLNSTNLRQEQMIQRQNASSPNQLSQHEATSSSRYAEENYAKMEAIREQYDDEKGAEENYTSERYSQERSSLVTHPSADYDRDERHYHERERPLIKRPHSYHAQQQLMPNSEHSNPHSMERTMAFDEPSPLIEPNASIKQTNHLNRDLDDEINQGIRSDAALMQKEQVQPQQTQVKPNPVRRQSKPIQTGEQGLKDDDRGDLAIKNQDPSKIPSKPSTPKTQVFCISVQMRKNMEFRGRELVSCLQQQEMLLGEYDIFHRHSDRLGTGKILFSVANMFNPGSFPMKTIHQFRTQGITFFMSLPCPGEAEQNFNLMLQTAQEIADMLGGDVRDHEHNLITPQRIDEYREQIRQFYTQV